MQAVEFNSSTQNGILKIPQEYQNWHDKNVRVILLPATTETTLPTPSNTEIETFFAGKALNLEGYQFDREDANAR